MASGVKLVGFLLPVLFLFHACSPLQTRSQSPNAGPAQGVPLTVMSAFSGDQAALELKLLRRFTDKRGDPLSFIPSFEATEGTLEIYQDLFRRHSQLPDILEVDVVWPPLLAGDLVDLKPYLGADLASFPPALLKPFTMEGRLVGIPISFDTGILYYRSDLLAKYGFRHPPQTWDELESMAKRIQDGERRQGNKNFWGYVWQGVAAEVLTCNALEWQSSSGGGQILTDNGTVDVRNRNALQALKRAVNWVGTISPPGVIAHDEDDSLNIWRSGNAAFMRQWEGTYGALRQLPLPMRNRLGVALLPHGAGATSRVLGGYAAAVSKYSIHRDEAIAVLRYMLSAEVQIMRVQADGTLPTRSVLQQNPVIMRNTPFYGPLAGQVMTGAIARPSIAAGPRYAGVSRAYYNGIHAALTRQVTPEQALATIQKQIVEITGFRPAPAD